MQEGFSIETLRGAFKDFSDRTTSVYVPRPVIEIGGEKWRILRKNVIDEINELAPDATWIVEKLEAFELPDFRANGIAFFDDGKTQRTAHLNHRPIASITVGRAPFLLPLLADFQQREAKWVLALDKDTPKLFLYAGGAVNAMHDRLEAPDYDGVEQRREVQDDVFFHSNARGAKSSGEGPGAAFHALGTDKNEEREKTDEAYFRDVLNAVSDALPLQTTTLHVLGEESTVGHFAKLGESATFDIVQHHEGLGNDIEAQILELFTVEGENYVDALPENASHGLNEGKLREAALEGRIETLYLPAEHGMLESFESKPSEHLKLRELGDDDAFIAENEAVRIALENGSNIAWYDAGSHDSLDEMRADLRW